MWLVALGAVLGAICAVGGQTFHEWRRDQHRRSVVLLALEEELRAVDFRGNACHGFTSQTFDEFFADIAGLLDSETARITLRYYLRMKQIHYTRGVAVQEMGPIRDRLLERIRKAQPRALRASD